MAITTTTTVVCDCCGYSAGTTEQYGILRVTTTTAQGQVTQTPEKYLCHAKGCDTHFTSAMTSTFNTDSATHIAAITGGVIPQHP